MAAAQEERFTRKKGDAGFPHRAVNYCLESAGIAVADLTHVGFYDKPLLKFERILETYMGVVPRGFRSYLMAGPLWIKEKLYTDSQLKDSLGYHGQVFYAEHHESHAASAFFPSPFDAAAVLTMDGVGEWATASIGVGRGNDIEILTELQWPDSLGLLYSAFTQYCGLSGGMASLPPGASRAFTASSFVRMLDIHTASVATRAVDMAVTTPPAPRWALIAPSDPRRNSTGPRLDATMTNLSLRYWRTWRGVMVSRSNSSNSTLVSSTLSLLPITSITSPPGGIL